MHFRAELNYVLKDMWQFEKVHQLLRSKTAYYAARILLIVATVMVLGAGAVLVYYRAFDAQMIMMYLFLLILYALWFVVRELRVRAALRSLMAQGCITVTTGDDGMHAEAKSIASSFGYNGYCDLVHSGDTYYLYFDKRKAQIIPERCFVEGDPAAFGAFLEEKTGLKVKEIK